MANTLSPGTAELAGTAAPQSIRTKRGIRWGRIADWGAVGLLIFISLFPFYWMVRTALSPHAAPPGAIHQRRPGHRRPVAGPGEPDAAEPQAGAGPGLARGARGGRDADVGRCELLHRPAQFDHRLHADHDRAGDVLLDVGLRVRAAEVPGPGQDLLPVSDGDDDPADLHADPELRADQEPGLAEHLPGDHRAVLPDDAVRGVLPAPVLPRHQQGGRRGGAARRRRPLE